MGKIALAGVLCIVLLAGCGILPPALSPPTAISTATAQSTATDAPTIIVLTSTPMPTSTPIPPTATPVPPTATPVPLVVSAGGDGVFIRIVPEKPDRYKAWADGTSMTVVGADRVVDGRTWKNVQDPDGNVGWIPTEYLKPKPTPTSTPTEAASPSATSTPGG